MTIDISTYLRGERLYGDDFDQKQIRQWFIDESEGYANLGAGDRGSYSYGYHAWNMYHAYRYLENNRFEHALGFGSAYGDELHPLLAKIERLTIIDPSDKFEISEIGGVPTQYRKPEPSGRMQFLDESFDLITCLGVLHHIPNVSLVVQELARVLKPGGVLIIREPICSMGDWRKPRRGLTKHERGIPLKLFEEMIFNSNLRVIHRSLCGFPAIPRIFARTKNGPYNNWLATRLDALMAGAFSWNINYHPMTRLQKLRPTSAFFVLSK